MENYVFDLGYTELYEWAKIPNQNERLARFVSYDKEAINKVTHYTKDSILCGVSTICGKYVSDNPERWPYKYACNEFLDPYIQKKNIAKGVKQYDQVNEMSFIQTFKSEELDGVVNQAFNPEANYIQRVHRPEWVKVTILGKTIVEDDGTCVPGQFCSPYEGTIKEKFGIAIPSSEDSKHKFYVLARVSKNTIMIAYK